MLPFGHLIFAWVIGLIIQKLARVKISRLAWALLLFGAILPDVDYLFSLFLGVPLNRGITHSLIFVVFSFFTVFVILNHYKLGKETMFFSFGLLTHLFADIFFPTGIL